MKDFKKLPKMKCGGGVKKYATGGAADIVGGVREAYRSGKNLDPGILAEPKTRTVMRNIDGEKIEVKPVPMPRLNQTDEINIPGVGRGKLAPIEPRGNLQLLKKGGKVKRGNKK